MLILENVTVLINWNKIIKNIDLTLKKWEILALLGHNWSGKTTLIKAIMWLLPSEGKIIFKWKEINNLETFERAKLGLWYVMQEIPEYPWISIFLYVKNILDLYWKFNEEKIKYYFDMFWLSWETYKHRSFWSWLSWWEKKKIEIITSFLLDKDVYLLDEIETSLDTTSKQVLIELIKDFQKKWKSFILVSHNQDMLWLANRWILLCNWCIYWQWKVENLLKLYFKKCEICNWGNYLNCNT